MVQRMDALFQKPTTTRFYSVSTSTAAGSNVNMLTFNGFIRIKALMLSCTSAGTPYTTVSITADNIQVTGVGLTNQYAFLFSGNTTSSAGSGVTPTLFSIYDGSSSVSTATLFNLIAARTQEWYVGEKLIVTLPVKTDPHVVTLRILYDDIGGGIIGAVKDAYGNIILDRSGNPLVPTDPTNTVISTELGILDFDYSNDPDVPVITQLPFPTE